LAATQVCPALRILAATAPSTAASRSASSNTRKGALPPSSIEVRSTPCAAWPSSTRPTSVEPVKDSLRSRGSAITGAVSRPEEEVGTTLSTPVGRSRASSSSRTSSAKNAVVSGVRLAGLITTGQPAASAGATLRVIIAIGKFHGVISSAGPTGARSTSWWWVPAGARRVNPSRRTACSAYQRTYSAA
jgi:hypothetical protein